MNINDKDARVKYIRALERFLGSCVSALKNENFDFILFVKRAEKGLKTLRKVDPSDWIRPTLICCKIMSIWFPIASLTSKK